MLEIQNISVNVDDSEILHDVSFKAVPGKNICLLGKNGSGKSSLALAVMGHPDYMVTGGDILIDGESILKMEPNERAQKWIFLAFQTIPEVKWVKLFEFLRTIYNARFTTKESFVSFKKIILPYLEELHVDKEFLRRDLNVGFSGGEKRKIEILQLKLLQPTYIFLDEVDSGLDVDAFRDVAKLLRQVAGKQVSFVVITHYFTILEYLPIDVVYVLEQGKIVEVGGKELVDRVQAKGFGKEKT